MPASTAAPWSIPYPVGTDRVADGDNAMQAIADRVQLILNTAVDPWVNMSLGPGVTPIGSGSFNNPPASRLLPGGMVVCRGLVVGGSLTVGFAVALLTPAHRPTAGNVRVVTQIASSGGGLQVGTVTIEAGGNITFDSFASAGSNLATSLSFVFSRI